MPRLHCPVPLSTGAVIALPEGAARHAQVLRLQPGDAVTLFDGHCGEYGAVIERMGRSEVTVTVGPWEDVEREAPRAVHLAVVAPANERMDWLVEKATELGAASVQPLVSSRSVLRLAGERAQRKRTHWEAIAASACAQCGRNRVPPVHPVQELERWLAALPPPDAPAPRLLLSLDADAAPLSTAVHANAAAWLLSGPEGGLSPEEVQAARRYGFAPVTLGPRVLRAETAPLAALAALTLCA